MFKFRAKIEMTFSQILAIRLSLIVSKSKTKWYKRQKNQKLTLKFTTTYRVSHIEVCKVNQL